MFKAIETHRGFASDTADHQPPPWNPGSDGKKIVVFEIQDVPIGSDTGIPICQVAACAEWAEKLQDLIVSNI